MGKSRIEKYKDYRNSILTEDAPVLETPTFHKNDQPSSVKVQTTSTLPMDQVMQALDENGNDVAFLKQNRKKKIILYTVLTIFAVALVAAIVVVGIILFK